MRFIPDGYFHIYNRGHNRKEIFFTRENYRLFIDNMSKAIKPYTKLLGYCLMPNHFHLLVQVNSDYDDYFLTDFTDYPPGTHPVYLLNNAIGQCLRKYAKAMNIQQKRSGALFQEKTKAKNLYDDFVHLASIQATMEFPVLSCLDYIHQNPVKAGLAEQPRDWLFSSIHDYIGFYSRYCDDEYVEEVKSGVM